MADDQWWFDLNSKSAIQDNKAGKARDRLGPYATREEAERALQKVDERNEEADQESDWED